MLNGHGDDIYRYDKKIVSNFSSNIYSRQDLSALQAHLCANISQIHSYPEPDAYSLSKLLAKTNNLPADNICITNGATEAIYLIAQAFSNSKTAIIIPTFSEYEDACSIHSHELFFYEKLEDIESHIQMVWLCNPNNPNGFVYDKNYLEGFVKQYPNIYFVFDQSYGHFTDRPAWDIAEVSQLKNVILLHSMTKQYAIPGLRLGYITAYNETLKLIEKYRMPWSVNQLAIEAGKFLLTNSIETIIINDYLAETKRLQNELGQIEGLTVFSTDTHFFLCKLENQKASDLKTYLIDNFGILIRDAANFRGLNEHYFRIAAQSAQENNILIRAIKEWI